MLSQQCVDISCTSLQNAFAITMSSSLLTAGDHSTQQLSSPGQNAFFSRYYLPG